MILRLCLFSDCIDTKALSWSPVSPHSCLVSPVSAVAVAGLCQCRVSLWPELSQCPHSWPPSPDVSARGQTSHTGRDTPSVKSALCLCKNYTVLVRPWSLEIRFKFVSCNPERKTLKWQVKMCAASINLPNAKLGMWNLILRKDSDSQFSGECLWPRKFLWQTLIAYPTTLVSVTPKLNIRLISERWLFQVSVIEWDDSNGVRL